MRLFSYLGVLIAGFLLPQAAWCQHPIDIQRSVADGDYFQALVSFEQMPKRKANTESLVAAARSAWALSLPDMAIDYYDKALHDEKMSDVDRARIYLSRGVIEYQEDRYEVANLYAEKAAKLLSGPSSLRSKAWLLWGEGLAKLKQYGAAEEKYQKALADASPEEEAEVHYVLGLCEQRLGKLDDAKTHLESVPLQHDRTPSAIRNLAEVSLETGNFSNAGFWLKKGREEYPDSFLDSWVDFAMLRVAESEKNDTEVIQIREAAQKKYPPSDPWLTLLNAEAEGYAWTPKGGGK